MDTAVNLTRSTRLLAVAAIGALTLGLAACGSDNEPDASPTGSTGSATTPASTQISGQFRGAGSSAQKAAIAAWTAQFQGENPGATVNYDAVGSGAGREQFLAGGVPWAGSDAALKDEEIASSTTVCGADGAFNVPVYISPILVAFNLPGITTLNLAPATIADIFSGKITTWDDKEIAADNPDVNLPSTKITPVHRSDKSGTTQNFTDYLHATAPDAWTDESSDTWPLDGGNSGEGTSGLIGVVSGTEGAVGYADESGVTGDLGHALVKVGDTWTDASAEGAAAVVDASPLATGRSSNDISVQIDRTVTTAGAYPLILVSYSIVCSEYTDAAQGDFVKAFVGYQVSPEGQQVAAAASGSAPLSEAMSTKAAASIAAIKVG